MSTDTFALILAAYFAAYFAAWGLIAVLLHRTRPQKCIDRHYAADGTTTTTSKDIA